MYPEGNPGEAVPLQGAGCDGFPGQTSAHTMVQYTTVNITTEPPQDHIIWSICCFAYSNPLCLGLAALIYSIKARDRKVAGDLDGARHYGATARCLNIVSTVLVSIIILTVIIMFIWFVNEINSYRYNYNYNNYNNFRLNNFK